MQMTYISTHQLFFNQGIVLHGNFQKLSYPDPEFSAKLPISDSKHSPLPLIDSRSNSSSLSSFRKLSSLSYDTAYSGFIFVLVESSLLDSSSFGPCSSRIICFPFVVLTFQKELFLLFVKIVLVYKSNFYEDMKYARINLGTNRFIVFSNGHLYLSCRK